MLKVELHRSYSRAIIKSEVAMNIMFLERLVRYQDGGHERRRDRPVSNNAPPHSDPSPRIPSFPVPLYIKRKHYFLYETKKQTRGDGEGPDEGSGSFSPMTLTK